MEKYNSDEVLKYLFETGIIDMGNVEEMMEKKKLSQILKRHPYAITQGKNGRWYTYVYDEKYKHNRRQIAKSSKEAIYDELISYYENPKMEVITDKYITLEELYPKWIKFKELHTNASTYITRIKSEWKKHYLNTAIIKVPICELTKLMLDEWVHKLVKKNNMSKNQYYNCTVIMNQALDYAVDLELIESNPFKKVRVDGRRMFRVVRKKSNETQVFTIEEEKQFKKLAWEDFTNRTKLHQLAPLALLFQFETGVRIGELVALRYEDVDGDYITVQRMLRREEKIVVDHTKGTFGDREVILTSRAKEIIGYAKERQEELGVSTEGYIFSITDEPVSYHSVEDLYRKYSKKLGIETKSSHKARKTFISSLIDAQMNINTIREMVGHADEKTTYNNYCFDRKTKDERIALMEKALVH